MPIGSGATAVPIPAKSSYWGHRDGDIIFRYPHSPTGNLDVRDTLRIVAALHDLCDRYCVPAELAWFTEFWATYAPRIEEPFKNLPENKRVHLGRRYRWCNVRREPDTDSQGPYTWLCLCQENLEPDPGEIDISDLTDFTWDGPLNPRR